MILRIVPINFVSRNRDTFSVKRIIWISSHSLQLWRDGHLFVTKLMSGNSRRNRIRKFFQAEPISVHRNPKIAQINRFVGARKVFGLGWNRETGQRGRTTPSFARGPANIAAGTFLPKLEEIVAAHFTTLPSLVHFKVKTKNNVDRKGRNLKKNFGRKWSSNSFFSSLVCSSHARGTLKWNALEPRKEGGKVSAVTTQRESSSSLQNVHRSNKAWRRTVVKESGVRMSGEPVWSKSFFTSMNGNAVPSDGLNKLRRVLVKC